MAKIAPGTLVALAPGEAGKLAYPPTASTLVVAVHPAALKAPHNSLTLTVSVDSAGSVTWVGAVDEQMMAPTGDKGDSPRLKIAGRLAKGSRCWEVIRPGLLTAPGTPNPYLTLYGGDRPWVVVGELENSDLLAVPLNDARGNPKWYAPQVDAKFLHFSHAKHSQLELAHLWSLPRSMPESGSVDPAVRLSLQEDTIAYYS